MGLQFRADRTNNQILITVTGMLDRRSAGQLQSVLADYQAVGSDPVCLDLSGCIIGEQAGIDAVVSANRSLHAAGTQLRLIGARPPVQAADPQQEDLAAVS